MLQDVANCLIRDGKVRFTLSKQPGEFFPTNGLKLAVLGLKLHDFWLFLGFKPHDPWLFLSTINLWSCKSVNLA